jgi:hypothetical protein
MSVVLTLIAIAALALCLLIWLISRLRADARPAPSATAGQEAEPSVAQARTASEAAAQTLSDQELAAQADMASESSRDVNFRPQGERGMGGPIYGDVLCGRRLSAPCLGDGHAHLL